MRIRRLRLSGFKSFVDPADLRIEPGLTGVVGPNGCGKSNLLEALRWAMGENSAKSLRGSGMEDVIFAGTATRPSREFAEVSILADGDDGDELEVVRRIERGAGSAYRINGRDVRAKDVGLVFADAATGAHSPALVSQGKIGAVIAAKPAERRAMLEEAAGIAGLHVRRKDAEQRLRATEANLTRLGEVIADQEARASQLKRQARQAERYRILSDRIRVAEARMIYARWRDAAAAADVAKREAEAAEALVTQRAEAQRAAATQRLERATRDVARVDAERAGLSDAAPLEAARDAARKDRARAERQIESARSGLSRADAQERSAIDAQGRAQSTRAAAHAELAALDSEAAALSKAIRPSGRDRLLDRLRAEPGYERALASALGDDLEAGLDAKDERYWAGAAALAADPPAPQGTTPLARVVEAPDALARRLAQVFVAERDEGQSLAVGQRLVTLAGVLRRWDGYVAKSGGAAAAERLERVNRLRALEKARPALIRAVDGAAEDLARIDADISEARRAAADCRRLLDASEATVRDAARAEDRAAGALERLEAQRHDLSRRAERASADRDDSVGEVTRAEAALAELPDGGATRERVAALTGDAEKMRGVVAAARAERAGIDQALAVDRERQASATADIRNWKARAGDAAKRIADMDKRSIALAEEAAVLAAKPAAIAAQIDTARNRADVARQASEAGIVAEREAEAVLRGLEATGAAAAEALAEARELRAGALARAENQELRRVEMGRLSGERFECPPPLLPERLAFDADSVREPGAESAEHERLNVERERIGPVNLVAETELAELETGAATNIRERDELETAIHRLRGSIGTLNREGRQRLLAAFEAVDKHFQRLFTTLFGGGQAHLALVDSDDPLEAGLEIMAQPPGKRLQSLTLLSGGEQALTAVALIFGLFLTNPAPICVLDEVDAPLDDANVERFCDLLDAMTRETDTRYLIVTHNAATMARMHRLFGVTMVEQGVSRLVSVDLGGAEGLLAAE